MIEHWIINSLCFSIAPLSYICFNQYKEIKKQKHIADIRDGYIKNLEEKLNKNG